MTGSNLLEGGGAGFGVTTRLTFATHDLPARFGFIGFIGFALKARSDTAYRTLVARFLDLARDHLVNPHWGEQVHFGPGHEMLVKMTFLDLSSDAVRDLWAPILDLARDPGYTMPQDLVLYDIPARRWWDMAYRHKTLPDTIVIDDASADPGKRFFWHGDNGETNVIWGGYESAWLSQELLAPERIVDLRDTIVAAAAEMRFAFHFQKGLAGGSPDRLAEAKETPVHPSVLTAFALLLVATAQPSVVAGSPCPRWMRPPCVRRHVPHTRSTSGFAGSNRRRAPVRPR